MNYEIRIYGDPVLRQKATPIDEVGEEIRTLAEDMLETMYGARGIGLAAQQIGLTRSICVIDIPPELDEGSDGEPLNEGVEMPMVLINPKITGHTDDSVSHEEGCLSFPEITAGINRPSEIDLVYTDKEGRERRIHACGLLARAVQHELDHLNGVLFNDHMSQVKRIALSGRLKRMRKKTEQKLGIG